MRIRYPIVGCSRSGVRRNEIPHVFLPDRRSWLKSGNGRQIVLSAYRMRTAGRYIRPIYSSYPPAIEVSTGQSEVQCGSRLSKQCAVVATAGSWQRLRGLHGTSRWKTWPCSHSVPCRRSGWRDRKWPGTLQSARPRLLALSISQTLGTWCPKGLCGIIFACCVSKG